MIVLGNSEFAVGMKFAGVVKSFTIKNKEEGLEILRKTSQDEFIITNVSVMEMLPELEDFENVVSVPDSAADFGNIDDLQKLIKSVIGIELEA